MTAQVVTIAERRTGVVREIIFDWLSTDGGAVSSTTSNSYDGTIEAVLIVPDTGGTAPDDLFDITLTDGVNDLLFDQGLNLSNAANTAILTNLGSIASKFVTLTVSNAGDANGGIVYVYIIGEPL